MKREHQPAGVRRVTTGFLVVAAFLGGAMTAPHANAGPGDDSPFSTVQQMARVLTIVENAYVDPVERDKLLEGAIKGMVSELDPHSTYLPRDDNAIFQSETAGKFGGVGIEVETRDDRVIVVAPIEGGPAERAGLKSGDRIVAIGGEPTRGAKLDKLVRKMRGDPGTVIEITILGKGETATRTVRLVREEIKVKSVTGRRLEGDIAYVRIKQFQANTHAEMLGVIGALRAGGALRGVVLDLRANPGGLVDQATAVADEFLGVGTIYTTRARGKIIDDVSATSGGALLGLPTAVLVNEYSASASELVAGALQDHKKATIVGAQTFGKGSVQSILPLPNGAGMLLTTMRYYSPLGRVIQAVGITPDVPVPSGIAPDEVVRERDLDGVLPPADGVRSPPAADAGPSSGDAGPREAETENGIAKVIPPNPSRGADRVLATGYDLVRAQLAPRPAASSSR